MLSNIMLQHELYAAAPHLLVARCHLRVHGLPQHAQLARRKRRLQLITHTASQLSHGLSVGVPPSAGGSRSSSCAAGLAAAAATGVAALPAAAAAAATPGSAFSCSSPAR